MGGTVTAEEPGRGQFAQAMADHFFIYKNRQELMAIMDRDRMTDEFRCDHAAARPGLDNLFIAAAVHLLNFKHQLRVYVRSFFCRTSHEGFLIKPPKRF